MTRQPQTPAEALRRTLDRLEAELGRLNYPDREQPVEILELLDDATRLLSALSSAGSHLAPERVRLETATSQFRKKRKLFLHQIGGASALATLRSDRAPAPEAWWWYLDQQLDAERRAARRRTVRYLATGAGALGVIVALYATFLMPDRATRRRYRYEQAAEQALSQGNLTEALTGVTQALSYAPGDGELLVLQGVILDLTGDAGAAERAFDEAEQSFDTTEQFLADRVEVLLLARKPEGALRDARQILASDPGSAVGYLLVGNASAALGNLPDARDAYATAAELAAAAEQIEIEGLARVQLANLTLLLSVPGEGTPVPSQP